MKEQTLTQLLEVAASISNRSADQSGFVTLTSLAREMQADLKFRPLLVEGIAAQPKLKNDRWLILIDSETHRVSEEMLHSESAANPLGARLRNTVAHELAHALGPRCEVAMGGSDKSRKEVVTILERETERLSPALLIPRRAIEELISARRVALDIHELTAARDHWGVSAQVFVRRFELISREQGSPLRHHPRLADVIIGSGEWTTADRPELHPMPFKGGVGGFIPEFAAKLRNHTKIAAAEFFPSSNFYLNGGADSSSSAELWIGTASSPQGEKAEIEISVEVVPRTARESFLWIARRKAQ